MMEALHSSEILLNIRAARRPVPEGGNLHSESSENLKSYEHLCDISSHDLHGSPL
jgi:hypothetical protein